jgi:ankyrin repeat protein
MMDEEGNTALHWAAVGGHVQLVKLLLDNGADIEAKSRDGFVPMHSVAQVCSYYQLLYPILSLIL